MSRAVGLNKRVQDLAFSVLAEMGGQATIEDVGSHIKILLDPGDRDRLLFDGICKLVGEAFRRTGVSGLPLAPAIDAKGTHMQLELLSESEFRYVIRGCLVGKQRYQRRAEQWRDRCFQLHGVLIDLDEVEQEIGSEVLTA